MADSSPPPTWTNTQQVIAYSLVISFILVIFIWMVFPPKAIDQAALTVVNMLLGALVAKFTTIIDFFFGSSQGSKDKDAAQDQLVQKLTGTGNGTTMAVAAAAAAAKAAPPAAAAAAPPIVAEIVPPAVDAAVDKAMSDRKPT